MTEITLDQAIDLAIKNNEEHVAKILLLFKHLGAKCGKDFFKVGEEMLQKGSIENPETFEDMMKEFSWWARKYGMLCDECMALKSFTSKYNIKF